MDWGDLRYFLAVARAGRLSPVARTLGVEHTTVGRRISALEATLGAPLFHRTSAGWRLTRVGEQILPKAEAMEREARELVSASYSATARTAGIVRLACVESWAVDFIAPQLPSLRARHPELEVELLTGLRQLSLTRGEADVAFRVPKPRQPDLSAQTLGEGSIGLYALPELARRWQPALERGSADGIPLAIFTPEVEFLQDAPWFVALRARANILLRTSSTLSLVEYALTGEAIVPAASWLVAREPRLQRVGNRDLARHRLWVVAHKEMRRDRRVSAVFQWARDVLAPIVAASERA